MELIDKLRHCAHGVKECRKTGLLDHLGDMHWEVMGEAVERIAALEEAVESYKRTKLSMHESYRRLEERADDALSLFLLYGDHLPDCEAPCSCGFDIEFELKESDHPPPSGWHAAKLLKMRRLFRRRK